MIHTIRRPRLIPRPPVDSRSPVECAVADLMDALYTVRREFSPTECERLGQAVLTLRDAALGERGG